MVTDNQTDALAPTLPAEADRKVDAAREALQRGQLQEAEGLCVEALALRSDHREGLFLLAAIQRFSRRPLEALATSSRLIEIDSGYGRAYQERGLCLRALGRDGDALTAFQDAVALNSGLLPSWRALAELQQAAGNPDAVEFARAQCAFLESLPDELQVVVRLIQEHRLGMAENLCRGFLQKHGHHTEGMRLLAEIGVKFNSYDEAEFLLESCLVLEPQNTNAHFDYVNVLNRRQKFGEAVEQAKALREKAPGKGQFDLLYANQILAVGEFDEALAIYRQQIEKMPRNPTLHLSVGHAL